MKKENGKYLNSIAVGTQQIGEDGYVSFLHKMNTKIFDFCYIPEQTHHIPQQFFFMWILLDARENIIRIENCSLSIS